MPGDQMVCMSKRGGGRVVHFCKFSLQAVFCVDFAIWLEDPIHPIHRACVGSAMPSCQRESTHNETSCVPNQLQMASLLEDDLQWPVLLDDHDDPTTCHDNNDPEKDRLRAALACRLLHRQSFHPAGRAALVTALDVTISDDVCLLIAHYAWNELFEASESAPGAFVDMDHGGCAKDSNDSDSDPDGDWDHDRDGDRAQAEAEYIYNKDLVFVSQRHEPAGERVRFVLVSDCNEPMLLSQHPVRIVVPGNRCVMLCTYGRDDRDQLNSDMGCFACGGCAFTAWKLPNPTCTSGARYRPRSATITRGVRRSGEVPPTRQVLIACNPDLPSGGAHRLRALLQYHDRHCVERLLRAAVPL